MVCSERQVKPEQVVIELTECSLLLVYPVQTFLQNLIGSSRFLIVAEIITLFTVTQRIVCRRDLSFFVSASKMS